MKLHLPIGLRRALLAVLHPVVIASALAAASAAAFAQESTNSSSSSGGTQTIDPVIKEWIELYNASTSTTDPKIYNSDYGCAYNNVPEFNAASSNFKNTIQAPTDAELIAYATGEMNTAADDLTKYANGIINAANVGIDAYNATLSWIFSPKEKYTTIDVANSAGYQQVVTNTTAAINANTETTTYKYTNVADCVGQLSNVASTTITLTENHEASSNKSLADFSGQSSVQLNGSTYTFGYGELTDLTKEEFIAAAAENKDTCKTSVTYTTTADVTATTALPTEYNGEKLSYVAETIQIPEIKGPITGKVLRNMSRNMPTKPFPIRKI